MTIDLRRLEDDADFRNGYLYFLQLANSYLAAIFWHVFPDSSRRKNLYETVRNFDADLKAEAARRGEQQRGLDPALLKSIAPEPGERRTGFLDCYKSDFVRVLRDGLPEERKRAFERKLRQDHAIPLRMGAFCDGIDHLRKKRHYLKDWGRNRNRADRPADEPVLDFLGLLLLPRLHHHFLGLVERHRRRIRRRGGNSGIDPADLRTIFARARRLRREETERAFGRNRLRSETTRAERRDREHSKQAWMRKYDHYFPRGAWPRYNYHQFRIRYFFMGKGYLGAIESALRAALPAKAPPHPGPPFHFQWEIEAVYETAMAVNAVLSGVFRDFEAADKTLSRRARKHGAGVLSGHLRDIRNAVAHNQPFFDIHVDGQTLPVRQVFAEIFAGFQRDHVREHLAEPPAACIGALCDKLAGLFRKQKFTLVFPVDDAERRARQRPPRVVRRWTGKDRREYIASGRWRIDKRPRVKALIAAWHRDLGEARQEATRRE